MTKQERDDCDTTSVRWLWIRHAPVEDREGIFTGQSDVMANLENARTEITTLAHLLAHLLAPLLAPLLPRCPDLWASSTLKRARQTTQALREEFQAQHGGGEQISHEQVLNEQDFNEQNFGDWEGERYDKIRHRALWEAPATHRPPDGESFADLVRRVARAVERIEKTHRRIGEGREEPITVVAVAHAGTIRAALAQALHLPPQHALSFAIDPLSLTRIDRSSYARQDEKKTDKLAIVHCVNVRQRQAASARASMPKVAKLKT